MGTNRCDVSGCHFEGNYTHRDIVGKHLDSHNLPCPYCAEKCDRRAWSGTCECCGSNGFATVEELLGHISEAHGEEQRDSFVHACIESVAIMMMVRRCDSMRTFVHKVDDFPRHEAFTFLTDR